MTGVTYAFQELEGQTSTYVYWQIMTLKMQILDPASLTVAVSVRLLEPGCWEGLVLAGKLKSFVIVNLHLDNHLYSQ